MLLREIASGKGPDGTEEAQVDIVAVHGLNPFNTTNHHLKTWSKPPEDGGKLWLRDELPKTVPNARVMIYKYNSNPTFSASKERFVHQANDLLERLWARRQTDPDRPLVFIAHSLGGILVKQALLNAYNNPRYRKLRDATSGLIFFGTPHAGGNDWLVRLGQASTRIVRGVFGHAHAPNELLEALKHGSPYADMLQENWRHQLLRFKIVSFYETKSEIVSRDSATIGLPGDVENVVALNADHSNMCRFDLADEEDESNYEIVATNVKDVYDHAMIRREETFLILPEAPSSEPGRVPPNPTSKQGPGSFQEEPDSRHETNGHSSAEADGRLPSRMLKLIKILESEAPELNNVIYNSYIQSFQHYQYSHTLDAHLAKHAEGTCEWLFGEDGDQGWISPAMSTSVWVHGPTGCGKSILAAYTTERLRKRSRPEGQACTVLFSFYEEYHNDTASSMMSIAIHQFLELHPDLLSFAFNHDGNRHHSGFAPRIFQGRDRSLPDLWSLFCRLVQKSEEKEVVFVLDGIERCDSTEVDALLETLYRPESPILVQLFGRRNDSIQRFFSSSIGGRSLQTKQLDLNVYRAGLTKDLDHFAHEGILRLRKSRSLSQAEADRIFTHLRDNLSAVFVSVKIVLEQLRTRTLVDLSSTLRNLPVDLQDLYQIIFRNIRNLRIPQVPRLFQYLLFAKRKLSLEEVHYAWSAERAGPAWMNSTTQEELKGYFRLLEPMVVLDSRNKIDFVHQSAKEFLVSKVEVLPPNDPLKLDPRRCHQDIAIACLQRLASATSVKFPAPYETGYTKLQKTLDENRLLEYALRYWLVHLREAITAIDYPEDIDSGLVSAVLQFVSLWKNSVGSELLKLIITLGKVRLLDYRKLYSSFELFSALGLTCFVLGLTDAKCTVLRTNYHLTGFVESALSLAISAGHMNVVTHIIREWDITSLDGPAFAGILGIAAQNGDSAMVKRLLAMRKRDLAEVMSATDAAFSSRDVATLDVLSQGRAFEDRDEWGNTVLHALFDFTAGSNVARVSPQASEIESIRAQIQLFVEREKVDITAREGNYGNTALHLACWYGYPRPIIETLISLGSHADTRNTFGWTALHLASRYARNSNVVSLLLELERPDNIGSSSRGGLNPVVARRTRGDLTPLHFAAQRWGSYDEDVDIVRVLLQAGADPHFPNRRGETPIQYAGRTWWGHAVFQGVYTRIDVVYSSTVPAQLPAPPQRSDSIANAVEPFDMESDAFLRGIQSRTQSWDLNSDQEDNVDKSPLASESTIRSDNNRHLTSPPRANSRRDVGLDGRGTYDEDSILERGPMRRARQTSISSVESVPRHWPPPQTHESMSDRFKRRWRNLFD